MDATEKPRPANVDFVSDTESTENDTDSESEVELDVVYRAKCIYSDEHRWDAKSRYRYRHRPEIWLFDQKIYDE